MAEEEKKTSNKNNNKNNNKDVKKKKNNNNKKNRSKFKTILLSILGLVLFGTVAFAGYTIYNFSSSAKKGYKETDFQ